MNIYPVILCGGNGTRLWPMSRKGYPKQFLKLIGDSTLLQQTALRLRGIAEVAAPLVVTGEDQRFLVAEQLRTIGVRPSSVMLEPVGRNTAPAIAVAALLAAQASPDALLLVLPSDHAVADEAAFARAVDTAKTAAEADYLVTFGIVPTKAHTGYGYIRSGAPLLDGSGAHAVDAFVEKPDAVTAQRFVHDGGYYWNSGMFMLKASVYIEELRCYEPQIVRQAELALAGAKRDDDFIRLEASAFSASPNISIDHAVMERTRRAAVVGAADLGWNDIGSWDALAELADTDAHGNTLIGDVFTEGVENAYIRAEHRIVAAIGLENVVIVETADAVLVADKANVQAVKKIVERLDASDDHEALSHRRVVRPWGSYEGIDRGERFQVKRIVVNPGAQLSLQMHHHRAEHWIVVKGTALVMNGNCEILLTENQSTYIPLGVTHRLINPGKIALELIEVQSGAYLGEDDIVRFEDRYGRAASVATPVNVD